jgi:hypothetical protein
MSLDLEDNEELDVDDEHMSATIEKAQENIRPILKIIKDACIQDAKGANTRQMDYSVNAFIQIYPNITHLNFYEKQFDLSNKIKDARCFFMLLQQLQPRTSRKVTPIRENGNCLLVLAEKCRLVQALSISIFFCVIPHFCTSSIFSIRTRCGIYQGQ